MHVVSPSLRCLLLWAIHAVGCRCRCNCCTVLETCYECSCSKLGSSAGINRIGEDPGLCLQCVCATSSLPLQLQLRTSASFGWKDESTAEVECSHERALVECPVLRHRDRGEPNIFVLFGGKERRWGWLYSCTSIYTVCKPKLHVVLAYAQ